MKPKSKEDVIESFPATIDELAKEQAESQEESVPEFVNDPNFIQDVMEVKVGQFISIQVSLENHKRKYFTETHEESQQKILVRKTCRIAGEARSNYYGLGFFISPQGFSKQPFPFYINEYGITWVAFRLEENENDNSRK